MNMALPRRRVLSLCCLPLATAGLSGCIGGGQQNSIALYVTNEADQKHSLDVEIMNGEDTVFRDHFTLSPGQEVQKPDAMLGGDYTATVTLDTDDPTTFPFNLNGCTENELSIIIMEGGELDYGMTDVCD